MPTQHAPREVTYTMSLGKNCDELLAYLAKHILPNNDPIQRPATLARILLMQALIDSDSVLERAVASINYANQEGLNCITYMDSQVQFATKKAQKRLRARRKAK